MPGFHAEGRDGTFDDSRDEPAPAGVGDGNRAAGVVRQEHGKAVCGENCEHGPCVAGNTCVGLAERVALASVGDLGAVHLSQPHRRLGQVRGEQGTILGNRGRVIADVVAKVEAGVGSAAHTARCAW